MTEDITPHNADLADILSGVSLPTDSVDIYMNAQGAYMIYDLNDQIRRAEARGDDTAELEKTREEVQKAVEGSRRTVELRGVNRHDRDAAIDKVMIDHPQEFDFLGRPKPDLAADRELNATMWALHIQRIVMPNGAALVAPNVETVKAFIAQAPDHAIKTIAEAINGLEKKTTEGFESMVQDHDFLSQP